MGFRLKQKSKRIRFNNFMQQRAAMDKLCRRITRGHDPKKMVVFFGAAVCSRGFRYAPTPVKGLRRHLRRYARVIIIQEHYTSQRYSFCAFKPEWITKPPHSHRKLQPGRDRQHPDPKKAEKSRCTLVPSMPQDPPTRHQLSPLHARARHPYLQNSKAGSTVPT